MFGQKAAVGGAGGRQGPTFVSSWTTTGPNQTVTLPTLAAGTYDAAIDWGDGNQTTLAVWDAAGRAHTYASAATYEVRITGTFSGFRFNDGGDKTVITTISNWGPLELISNAWFFGCSNLVITATDIPTLNTTAMGQGFQDCTSIVTIPNFVSWPTASITTIGSMFNGATAFNQDFSGLDTSSVTAINAMLASATDFDQDLGSLDITSTTNATNFLVNVTLSTSNYDALLIGWEGQVQKPNVTFHGGNSLYSAGAAATARAALATDGWTITDGGEEP